MLRYALLRKGGAKFHSRVSIDKYVSMNMGISKLDCWQILYTLNILVKVLR